MAELGGEFEKEVAKGLGELLPELYRDGPQQGYKSLFAALTPVLEYPLRWTYGLRLKNAEQRLNFERNFKILLDGYAPIPEDKVIQVVPEMAIPLLEKISYTSNEEIARLFINILAAASNEDTASKAHPAFSQMVERLSADEAKIIMYLRGKDDIPYMNMNVDFGGGYGIIRKYFTQLNSLDLVFPQNIPSYMSNFVGMGILFDNHTDKKSNDDYYSVIRAIHNETFTVHAESYKKENSSHRVYWAQSLLEITDFGSLFIDVCTNNHYPTMGRGVPAV